MRFVRLASGLLFLSLIASTAALGSSGKPAVLKHVPPARLLSNTTSLNWSGYAATNSTFSDVKGSWVQPAATCNGKSTFASFWLGLDGDGSSTVEQIGTEADCAKGKPVYYAWWELFPGPSRPIGLFTVTPGATYTAEVKVVAGDLTLTISGGGNQPFSLGTGTGSASLSSAELIAEAPSMCTKSGCHELALTDFGTVSFSGASVNGSAIDDPAWNLDPLTMVTGNGTVKAVPSGLDPTGSAFSVTWHHS